MTRSNYGALALACATLFLASCGGGDTGPSTSPSATTRETARPAAIVTETSNDVILTVSLAWGSTGNQIAIRDKNNFWTVPLYKTNGSRVTSLDDLPEGIANSAWVTSPPPSGHLRIRFLPHSTLPFRLQSGWVWPAAASGHDANRQIVMEKVPGAAGDVAILGSVPLSATYTASAGKVTLATSLSQPYEQLWAEGNRAIRARHPNAGSYFYVKGAAQGWPVAPGSSTVSATYNDVPVAKQAFQVRSADFPTLSAIKAANDTQAVVVMMDSWQITRHRVAEVDSVGERVRLAPATIWEIGKHGVTGQRYFVENTLAAMDAPGEWFASGNTLQYKPAATANGGTVKFEVPQVEKLLVMNGALANGKWVQYVQFSNLKFRYARANLPTDYIDGQADTNVPAAIELNEARHIEFANCEVSRTGGYGIWLNNKVRHVTIASSELYDLGAGGVKIGKSRPTDVFPIDWTDYNDVNVTSQNTVTGNRIHSTGHVFPGAVGVWIGRSDHNQVTNNLIKDTTYSGISVGWKWDGGPTMAKYNTVARNFLENIGQESLADMGGVYLLGRAPGTWVNGNVIKNVKAYDGYTGGGRGIYADEGSSDLTVLRNIVLGANGAGYFQNYGEANVVTDNVFADVDHAFTLARRLKVKDMVSMEDVVSTAHPAILVSNSFLPRSNAMVELSTDPLMMAGISGTSPNWVTTVPDIRSNVVAPQFLGGTTLAISPLCTDCTTGTLTVSNPGALRVPTVSGMTYTEGVDIAQSWHNVALSPTISAARLWAGNKPEIPAKVIDFKAVQWPLGATALQGWQVIAQPGYVTETNPPEPLSIEQDGGTKFLALADAHRSDFPWEPFIQNWMNYGNGTAVVTFTAKFDAKADIQHVWRSDDNATKVGPSLQLKARATSPTTSVIDVIANGTTLTSVPVGTWVTFEVQSPVAANSTWRLKITQGAACTTYGNLAPVHQDWSYLGPVLFVSNANERSTTAFSAIDIKKQENPGCP